eukprot:CAMPEP_0197583600 /NCGR_PEP_ID=MMETSP1326-20131121/6472_2 /TAXON_ID=1155430 /ORGANISM="Genus nov. species nov., Strain RCC2288" /LENGTH=66 /DNA_ID=CAMNT_0043147843 /DNA_START=167 /DNA_END=363 /DNA_ORIENTATION=-
MKVAACSSSSPRHSVGQQWRTCQLAWAREAALVRCSQKVYYLAAAAQASAASLKRRRPPPPPRGRR